MSADVEFGVDFNRQNISRTHAKRERESRGGGGGKEGAECEKNGSTHLKPT